MNRNVSISYLTNPSAFDFPLKFQNFHASYFNVAIVFRMVSEILRI